MESAVRNLRESSRLNEVFQDFLGMSNRRGRADKSDLVEDRFHLVKKDINRLLNRLQSNAALSVNPEPDDILVEMLDRLAMWQRAWGSPLKHLDE
jgi:hypothetical protein